MKVDHLLLLLFWAGSASLCAQYVDGSRFGEVTPADRQLMVAPGDTSAEAYVLYDHLDLGYRYADNQGPSIIETYHRRVKLLKPSSFDRANVTISYDRDDQDVDDLQAVIHLPGGGSILLKPIDFVRDKDSDGYATIKFTFPQVTAGAIVEYSYTLSRRSILTPTVYRFQESVPVRWAEYSALIPPYYKYVILGNQSNYYIQDAKLTKQEFGPNFNTTSYSGNGNRVEHSDLRWVMRDLPAFESQPYTNNADDYIPRVRLQLQAVQYPGRPAQDIFSDWKETVDRLQDRQDFGRYYRNKTNYGKLWKAAEPLLAAADSDRRKIEAAYRFILEHLSWNGDFSILASQTPNDSFSGGKGNSADLNMCLLALLNEAGIPAHPLLVSLRDHGAPIEIYPVINQFDHLMVYTEVDGQPLLLDVNDHDRPAGLPRVAALNHRGWVADKDDPRWIDIDVPPAKRTIMQEITVGEDGVADVALTGRMESYFAFSARSSLREAKTPAEAPLADEILAHFPEMEVTQDGNAGQEEDVNGSLDYSLRLRVPSVGQVLDDYLYVQPFLLTMLDGELDDVETRLYPIDFAYPWQQRFIVYLTVPEGYVLEDVPANVRVRAEDGSMVASFASQVMPNGVISLLFNVTLDRTFYPADHYPGLRDMYRRIIELQETPLVFKRAK